MSDIRELRSRVVRLMREHKESNNVVATHVFFGPDDHAALLTAPAADVGSDLAGEIFRHGLDAWKRFVGLEVVFEPGETRVG